MSIAYTTVPSNPDSLVLVFPLCSNPLLISQTRDGLPTESDSLGYLARCLCSMYINHYSPCWEKEAFSWSASLLFSPFKMRMFGNIANTFSFYIASFCQCSKSRLKVVPGASGIQIVSPSALYTATEMGAKKKPKKTLATSKIFLTKSLWDLS